MKHSFFVWMAALLWACNASDSKSVSSSAAAASPTDALKDSASFTTLQWLDPTSQNLGKIKQGQVAEISWQFRNSGAKPLVIQNVRAGCGCTVAEQPQEPILSGKEGVIKAKFDSKSQHEGPHTKYLYVYANTAQNTMHELRFQAEVVK